MEGWNGVDDASGIGPDVRTLVPLRAPTLNVDHLVASGQPDRCPGRDRLRGYCRVGASEALSTDSGPRHGASSASALAERSRLTAATSRKVRDGFSSE